MEEFSASSLASLTFDVLLALWRILVPEPPTSNGLTTTDPGYRERGSGPYQGSGKGPALSFGDHWKYGGAVRHDKASRIFAVHQSFRQRVRGNHPHLSYDLFGQIRD